MKTPRPFWLVLGVTCILAPAAMADGLADCLESSDDFITTNGGCTQRTNGLTWGYRPTGTFTHDEASAFCEALPAGANGQGWSLPSVAELRMLSKLEGTTKSLAFPVYDYYWARGQEGSMAAAAIPRTGANGVFAKTEKFAAVCVTRAFGCLKETERFVNARGGCMDLSTGITWSNPIRSGLSWYAARGACANLGQAGNRWTLAGRDSMESITRDTQAVGVIPNFYSGDAFWTASEATGYNAIPTRVGYSGSMGPASRELPLNVICAKAR